MPHLSWNEVRDRAIRFSRDPVHTRSRSERAEKQTFWNDFFEVFGLRRASLASCEDKTRAVLAARRDSGAARQGFVRPPRRRADPNRCL